jgi:hypothetical protein
MGATGSGWAAKRGGPHVVSGRKLLRHTSLECSCCTLADFRRRPVRFYRARLVAFPQRRGGASRLAATFQAAAANRRPSANRAHGWEAMVLRRRRRDQPKRSRGPRLPPLRKDSHPDQSAQQHPRLAKAINADQGPGNTGCDNNRAARALGCDRSNCRCHHAKKLARRATVIVLHSMCSARSLSAAKNASVRCWVIVLVVIR